MKQTPVAGIPWTQNRTVVVCRQRYRQGKEYVGVRVFNRHRQKGVWYPSPRYFVIPIGAAADLGEAIMDAACGISGDVPEWYDEFEKQYAAHKRKRKKRAASTRYADRVEPSGRGVADRL